ncbi:MAG UNVERIFIED_CONTAM: hypothetical protein LVR29_04375 [Microcystis novacekii LVE1205-3]
MGLLGLVGLVSRSTHSLRYGTAVSEMDARMASRFSWTLMLMLAGLMLGCSNAWAVGLSANNPPSRRTASNRKRNSIMIELLYFPLALLAGMAFGFGAFWGIVANGASTPRTHNPMVLTLISFLGRTSIILLGFYAIISCQSPLASPPLAVKPGHLLLDEKSNIAQVQPKFRSN